MNRSKLDLMNAIPKLGLSDKAFACSLLDSWNKRGSLSPKMEYWVETLVIRAATPVVKPAGVSVGSFSGVVELFKKPEPN